MAAELYKRVLYHFTSTTDHNYLSRKIYFNHNGLRHSLLDEGTKRTEGERVRPPTSEMGPYKNNDIGENTETQRKTSLIIITSTDMNCMINFVRVNVSQSARGSRSRQPTYYLESTLQGHSSVV